MLSCIFFTALVLHYGHAFPFVAKLPDVDTSLLRRSDMKYGRLSRNASSTCPINAHHTPAGKVLSPKITFSPLMKAAPINARYPYCGAVNGKPGYKTCVDNYVPAEGDVAHAFIPPGKNDIRGPCPGLNAPANHNFLSHDGITTFNELVDMQQNVFGLGYDLSVLLAAFGVSLDGDPVTEKLSIGCDATSRTTSPGLGPDGGLNAHLRMEGDASLTRNDYYLSNGDNYSFNETLFAQMARTAKSNFGPDEMALYRAQRYNQSRADNPTFQFGPKSLLRYGAASFLYTVFPSGGEESKPDLATQISWFVNERIPDKWKSREQLYSIPLISKEIKRMYTKYPAEFGGNSGLENFIGLGQSAYFHDSKFNGSSQDVACLLYQDATSDPTGSVNRTNLEWAASKLNPVYKADPLLRKCQLNYDV